MNDEKQDVEQILGEFIGRKLLMQKNRRIHPQEPLISNGLLDSFHLLDISLFIEDTFGVRLDEALLQKTGFNTLEELVSLVNARLK